jgi:hypothetical protein
MSHVRNTRSITVPSDNLAQTMKKRYRSVVFLEHLITLVIVYDQSRLSFSGTLRDRCGDTFTIQPALCEQLFCLTIVDERIRQSQVPQRLDKTHIRKSEPGRHSDKRSSAFAGALSGRLSHWVSLKNSTRSHDSMSIACLICSLY